MRISEYAKNIGVENYTLKNALDKIGFKYDFNKETNYFNNITCCKCGNKVECKGFIGTDTIVCTSCKKGLQDLTGIIIQNNCGTMLNLDEVTDFEEGKVWVLNKKEIK